MPNANLWSALQDGYFFSFKDHQEMMGFLQACQDLGLKWGHGEEPLGFIPYSAPYIEHKSQNALWCQHYTDSSTKVMRWSDLPSSKCPNVPQFQY